MGTADRRKVMRADDAKDEREEGSVSKRRAEEFLCGHWSLDKSALHARASRARGGPGRRKQEQLIKNSIY